MGPGLDRPVDVVRHLVAVQSQDYPAAAWALGQRTSTEARATASDVDAALDAAEILRTHVLRPTWHFVAPEDLRWLLALTGPRIQAGIAGRYRQLEIDAEVARRARAAFERRLRGGRSATREELRQALTAAGIEVDVARLTHLVMHAELAAVLCSGPRRGRLQTYALVEERIPPSAPRQRDEALADLAARYVAGHGPAQAVDLSWWSGLTVGDARRALEASGAALRREVVDGRAFWSPAGAAAVSGRRPDGPVLHLLPNFDEFLVAFRDRTDAIDPALPGSGREPGALLSHAVVRDGLVVGRWLWRGKSAGPVTVTAEPTVRLDEAERSAARAAGARLGTFLGRPLELRGLD